MQQTSLDVQGAPPDPARPVSKSGFAVRIGVTKARVSQLIAKGLPVRPDGKIDPAEAEAWFAENVDPRRRRSAPADQVDERPARGRAASVRGDIEAEKLRALKLENDRKAGATVDAAAIAIGGGAAAVVVVVVEAGAVPAEDMVVVDTVVAAVGGGDGKSSLVVGR